MDHDIGMEMVPILYLTLIHVYMYTPFGCLILLKHSFLVDENKNYSYVVREPQPKYVHKYKSIFFKIFNIFDFFHQPCNRRVRISFPTLVEDKR